MGGWEVTFPSPEAQAAGGYKRAGDNEPRKATVVKAVYFEDGEIFDHGKQEMVPEGHYRLLDASGRVIGHGDGYLGGEHAKAAIEGLLDGRDVAVAVEEGNSGAVADEDAYLGKVSATGSMHCPSCSAKVLRFDGRCDMCGTALTPPASTVDVGGDQ